VPEAGRKLPESLVVELGGKGFDQYHRLGLVGRREGIDDVRHGAAAHLAQRFGRLARRRRVDVTLAQELSNRSFGP